MGIFSKIRDGLRKTRDAIFGKIDLMLKSFTKIDEELFEELEELLVMGDVGIVTAEKICDELRRRVKQEGITDPAMIYGLLSEVITEMLKGGQELHTSTKPSVILVIGVNGVGKTTTIGKMAARFTSEGKKVILAAADTFRAAAIDQLQIWADRAGADIVRQNEGSDPAEGAAISSSQIPQDACIIKNTSWQSLRRSTVSSTVNCPMQTKKCCWCWMRQQDRMPSTRPRNSKMPQGSRVSC